MSSMKKSGESASIPTFTAGALSAHWKTDRDLDAFVVAERKDGTAPDFIFFNCLGPQSPDWNPTAKSAKQPPATVDITALATQTPPIQHHGDEGVGNTSTGGENNERISVGAFGPYSKLHFGIMDYASVDSKGKEPAAISQSGLTLKFEDNTGHTHEITLDPSGLSKTEANVCAIATINLTGSEPTLRNDSKGQYWNGMPSDAPAGFATKFVSDIVPA